MLRVVKNSIRAVGVMRSVTVARSMATRKEIKKVMKPQLKAPESLVRTLDSELQFEKQRYTEFKEGADFLKETGFTVLETPENTEIKLMKNVGDKTIEIKFQANEPMQDEDEEEEEEEGKGEEKEKKGDKKDDEEGKNGFKSAADFTVIVKSKDGSGLLFDCNSQETELNIYRVAYNKNIDDLTKDMEKAARSYLGPEFMSLDEKVQQSFIEYLESLGLIEKLLAYIECAAIDKEQKLYMNWIGEVKKFVGESQ